MKFSIKKGSPIDRLPSYYRYFKILQKNGVTNISSEQISQDFGFSSGNSILRDFKVLLPDSGRRKYGYNVNFVCEKLANMLNIHSVCKYLILGAGPLESVLKNNEVLQQAHYYYCATVTESTTDKQLQQYVNENNITMVVVLTPDMKTLHKLFDWGVSGVLNFSMEELTDIPEHIHIEELNILELFTELSLKMVRNSFETCEK